MMSATLLVLFLALMIIRVPIAVCLGLSSAVVMILFNLPMAVLAQRTVNALDSTPLD